MHIKARANHSARGLIRNVARATASNAPAARGRARIRVFGLPVQACRAFCG